MTLKVHTLNYVTIVLAQQDAKKMTTPLRSKAIHWLALVQSKFSGVSTLASPHVGHIHLIDLNLSVIESRSFGTGSCAQA